VSRATGTSTPSQWSLFLLYKGREHHPAPQGRAMAFYSEYRCSKMGSSPAKVHLLLDLDRFHGAKGLEVLQGHLGCFVPELVLHGLRTVPLDARCRECPVDNLPDPAGETGKRRWSDLMPLL
jgi:hypothetical protein